MIEFLNYLINGALIGLLYALIAMGFVVIYRASKVFNFAQGELVVFGGFLVWWMVMELGLPMWTGLPLAFAAAAAFGLLIERLFFSRLVGESVFSMVMVTIGLLILIRGVILVAFGPQVRPFPIVFPLAPIMVGDLLIPRSLFYGGLLTIVIGFSLSWFFNKTRAGLRMTAVAEDHQVAMSMGISVRRSVAFAWALGSVLSTLGAIVYLSGKSLNLLTSEIGMAALPVALLAGLESIGGLLLAGLLVGIVQGLAMAYLDPLVGGAVGSVLPFVIMLLVLLIRPTGMFGWKTIERV
ncbi:MULTISPECIES: branched-chain amino acid ABC transporter permease [Burkholderiales]|jgi:branched-chain amino acid transport system permease protein|uniref:Branched-chain amino acid transport system permease protein livH n=1 Tax=Bordetella petrii (strain ATCC BAA-461 / DSM 12804 / CCUG 43448 / CIP 107267 / Se-1111R) TaxID=340100 RepID=A9IBN4_BORPD|nr:MULTISPECIES: branched-chain amino acid ABC transporter permease [Burkholderiales]KAA1283595.1 branched-chain amino acid ABC transporter permease [Alcaligenes faecalis]KAB0602422.1 branched-chain amino acid ABC transporter permease [Cupriavidus pauculus]MBO9357775.1 branched-chain amino acid ABC transporter permease [Bordetella petrii]MCR4143219.1 branched-chain amino acid ABC transporter permease [Alcaligenes faecalis]MCT9013832.1 branched-chain amino acid ABC transporter permease [Cupriav